MPFDPTHKDFTGYSSEDFYEGLSAYLDEEMEGEEDECPEWIQEQLDEDLPF